VFFDGLTEATYRKAIRADQPAPGMSTEASDFCGGRLFETNVQP
jgi:hypothetical protein